MPVAVLARAGDDQPLMRHVTPRLVMERPGDVMLPPDGPAIRSADKQGADLELTFDTGETMQIVDFFVIGPEGDFSTLQDAEGTARVTGLMVPEPEIPGAIRLPEARSGGDADDAMPPQEDIWSDPRMLTGAGLATGIGTGLFEFGPPETGEGEGGREDGRDGAQEALARDVEALTRAQSAPLVPAEDSAEDPAMAPAGPRAPAQAPQGGAPAPPPELALMMTETPDLVSPEAEDQP
ncbi:hypothetical protein [Mangrovicoccus algicola]|uniref:Uncharacterized protein n=1 Tax=Mangrovicoccus algicola TaxID=2771008 RepID=A0A8J6YU18_9RHOB|nr:hypothetical protein [Mangrovicoccus algicola]MBE3637552.1 hypothetical protein [Mangrovicoccus algicola]